MEHEIKLTTRMPLRKKEKIEQLEEKIKLTSNMTIKYFTLKK